jgi:hypothetical protein
VLAKKMGKYFYRKYQWKALMWWDACSFQKPYACQQTLMKRHQLVENPFFLKFQKWKFFSKCASKVRNLSMLF